MIYDIKDDYVVDHLKNVEINTSFDNLSEALDILESNVFNSELLEEELHILSEEFNFEKIKDNVINWFKKIWSNISGWIAKTSDKISESIGRNALFLKKYKDDIIANANNIPEDGLDIGKWYEFPNFDRNCNFSQCVQRLPNIDKLVEERVGMRKYIDNSDIKYHDVTSAKAFGVGLAIDIFFPDLKIENVKEFLKAAVKMSSLIANKFLGEAKEGKIPKTMININEILDELQNATKTRRAFKDSHNAYKKFINGNIDKLKKMKKEELQVSADKYDYHKEVIIKDAYNYGIDICKGIMHVSATHLHAVLKVLGIRYAQYRNICKALLKRN